MDHFTRLVSYFAALCVCIAGVDAAEIHDAVQEGTIEIVKQLLDENPALLNAENDNRMTPLNIAALNGQTAIAVELLNRGADITIGDVDNSQPIHCAAIGGHIDVAELFLSKGVDIDVRDNNGATPLIFASSYGQLKMAEYLIEQGADINGGNNNHLTPLFYAAGSGNRDIVEFLIERGADIEAKMIGGDTPLHIAAARGRTDVCELLTLRGADIHVQNNRGETPLHSAVISCSLNTVKILCEHGAYIDAVDEEGMTSLHLAVARGKTEMVKCFLSQDAALNSKENQYARTELHTAAIKGYTDIVNLLIEAGAEATVNDNENKTPFDYALYHGFSKIAEILLPHGGDERKLKEQRESPVLLDKKLADKEAIIWYLGHSSWAIKTKNHFLIFDYFINPNFEMPAEATLASGYISPTEIHDENVTVFVTHHHGDHYDEKIFEWRESVPTIDYILGFRPQGVEYEYTFIGPRRERIVNDIKITTIRSNDAGVGFLVEVDDLVIFHSGDHANASLDMSGPYPAEIEYIREKDVHIDLAFFGITGCSLGDPESVKKGVHYAIERLSPSLLFPMHTSTATYRYKEFADEAVNKKYATQVAYAINKGDRFFFDNGKLAGF